MKTTIMNLNRKMKLAKYKLEFDRVLPFFKKHIEWKSLSLEILKRIDFRKGSFYTFLLPSANLQILYDFKEGIYPPNPRIGNYEPITHLNNELSEFIQDFLSESNITNSRLAIIEHALASRTDERLEINNTLIQFIGEEEVYYIVPPKASFEDILEAVTSSKEVWHFLAILTEGIQLDSFDESRYEEICKHIRFIITTAYDGEGYLLWEKNIK